MASLTVVPEIKETKKGHELLREDAEQSTLFVRKGEGDLVKVEVNVIDESHLAQTLRAAEYPSPRLERYLKTADDVLDAKKAKELAAARVLEADDIETRELEPRSLGISPN